MGEASRIAWTDDTFSPWWGCVKVSPGCNACYASAFATRVGHYDGSPSKKLPIWGVDAARRAMSDEQWALPLRWNRSAAKAGVRRRVFCASMSDVFEIAIDRNVEAARVMSQGRARLWLLIKATPWLTWMMLTKRPENIAELVPGWGTSEPWPENVWLGTTAENQKYADERIPILLSHPAVVHFVSHEPALERVDFTRFLAPREREASLAWIITGGESGPHARIYDAAWARDVIRQCREYGAAPFCKQLGSNAHDSARSMVCGWEPDDPEPDTRLPFRDRAGADPREWDAALRVQEFPR